MQYVVTLKCSDIDMYWKWVRRVERKTLLMVLLLLLYITCFVVLLRQINLTREARVHSLDSRMQQNVLPEQNGILIQQREVIQKPFSLVSHEQHTNVGYTKYFLSEILMVRLYAEDKARWTLAELKQWLHYMRYIGVQHVYLCDHFVHEKEERLDSKLQKYIHSGFITYIPWSWSASDNDHVVTEHQVQCYRHIIRQYGNLSEWQMSIDMDEYPFCPGDFDEGFLARYVRRLTAMERVKSVTQILLPNFLMLGQGDRTRNMTIERINRITPKVVIDLKKPLFKPTSVERADIHQHIMHEGTNLRANESELRMLHYWGSRVQKWGPDTQETMDRTVEYNLMRRNLADRIRRSLNDADEHDAFSNTTGP